MLKRCYDLNPLGTVLGMIFIELLHLEISPGIFGAIWGEGVQRFLLSPSRAQRFLVHAVMQQCNNTAMQPRRTESLNKKIYLSQNNNSAAMVQEPYLSWRVENFPSTYVILCLMFVSWHSAIKYVMTRTWCLKGMNNYNHQAAHLAAADEFYRPLLSRNEANGYLTV